MPSSYDPTLFNVSPYYDDFDEEKKFHRLLFKPGYAVQARELTQIQTVLQNQIERFGNHIFKEGSRVFGSEIVASDVAYIRMNIENSWNVEGVTQDIDLTQFTGKIIQQGTVNGSGTGPAGDLIKAKVIHTENKQSDNDSYAVFFIDYLQGDSFRGGETLITADPTASFTTAVVAVGDGSTLAHGGRGSTSAHDAVSVDGITGVAKIVSVTPGIYYINGSFVRNSKQTISPFALTGEAGQNTVRYFTKPSNKIGFNLIESITTSQDDFSLRDPSAGSYNYNAPGADRYKLELNLVHTQADVVSGAGIDYPNFIELLRFKDGKITYKNLYTQYNELEKTLARRTYDESGNYTVKPFTLSLYEHLDDGTNNGIYPAGKTSAAGNLASNDYVACGLSPGKAYIFGHEFETQASEYVDIRKARGADHMKTLDLYRPGSAEHGIWMYAMAHEDFACFVDENFSSSRNVNGSNIITNLWQSVRFWAGASAAGMPDVDEFGNTQIYENPNDKGIGCASSFIGYGHIDRIEPLIDINGNPVREEDPDDSTSIKQVYKVFLLGCSRRRPWAELNYQAPRKYFEWATRVTTRRYPAAAINSRYLDEWLPDYEGNTGAGGADPSVRSEKLVFKLLRGRAEWNSPRINRNIQYSWNNRTSMFWNDRGNASTAVTSLEYDFAWRYSLAYNTATHGADGGFIPGSHNDFDQTWPHGAVRFKCAGPDTTGSLSYTFSGLGGAGGSILDGSEYQHYILYRRDVNDDDTRYHPVEMYDDSGEKTWNISAVGDTKRWIEFKPLSSTYEITTDDEFILSADMHVKDNKVDSTTVATKKYKTVTLNRELYNEDGAGIARRPWWIRPWRDTMLVYTGHCDVHHVSKIEAKIDGISTDVTNDFSFVSGHGRLGMWHGRIFAKSGSLWSYMNLANDQRDIPNADEPSTGITVFANNTGEWNIPNGATFPALDITYSYFERTQPSHGLPAPCVVNSYTNGGVTLDLLPLENIRWCSARGAKPISATSMVDFRYQIPYHLNQESNSGWKYKQTGACIIPNSLKVSHNYILPRVDKIVLTNQLGSQSSTFQVLEGRPAEIPLPPDDRPDSMTLYSVIVPPYTFNPADLILNQSNNQRYTMKDIGNLDKKITAVEHYASLSLTEKDILGRQLFKTMNDDGITYDSELFKAGVFVDQFSGHNHGDVTKNYEYACSIDRENNVLRPGFDPRYYTFADLFDDSDGTVSTIDNLQKTPDDLIMIKVTGTEAFIEQNLASTSISVNPFNLSNYLGNLSINPPSSRKMGMTQRPVIKTYAGGVNDNWRVHSWGGYGQPVDFVDRLLRGFGTQWNDWESIWCGIDLGHGEYYSERGKLLISRGYSKVFEDAVPGLSWARTGGQAPRQTSTLGEAKSEAGLVARTNPEQMTTEINNKIIDRSVVPYLEPEDLTIKGSALKPNTTVHCFFDDRNVNEWCQLSDGQTGPFKTNEYGQIATSAGSTVSDITFYTPYRKFLTGEKLFRLISNEDNEVFQSSTSAEAIYYASGIQPLNSEFGIYSTRPPIVQKQTVTSNKIVRDITARNQTIDTAVNTQWVDPLAQTFAVDVNDYKNGLFLKSIDLYFAKIDAFDPVSIEIRPLLNGRPHGSHVIPFSKIIKEPDGTNGLVSDIDSPSVATNFEFSSPVFLPPGDFALVIRCNSVDTQLWAAEVGETDISTNQMIDRQPYSGVLFQPQNSSVAEINQDLDLMFTMNKCIFADTSTTFDTTTSFSVAPGQVGSTAASGDETHLVRLNTNELLPHATNLYHTIKWGQNDGGRIYPNENTNIDSYLLDGNVSYRYVNDLGGDGTTTISTYFKGTPHVSPVVDLKNFDLIGVRNVVNNITSYGEKSRRVWGYTYQKAAARYISRRVSLPTGILANNLRVYIDVNQEEDRRGFAELLDLPEHSNTSDIGIKVYAKYSAAGSDEQDEQADGGGDNNAPTNDDNSVLDVNDEEQNDFDDNRYYELTLVNNPFLLQGASDSEFDYRECEFRLFEIPDENEQIGTFAIKVVMVAKDSTKPPKVKNLRAVALVG